MSNLVINNFQKRNWEHMLKTDLNEVLAEYSIVDSENYFSVDYKATNIKDLQSYEDDYMSYIDEKKTFAKDLIISAHVKIHKPVNQRTSDITKTIPILRIPLMTDEGFIIKGVRYGMVSEYRLACGWVFGESTNAGNPDEKVMELRTKKGKKLTIGFRNHKMVVKYGESQPVDLAVFTKALCEDMSYTDILNYVGQNNTHFIKAFSTEYEPDRETCIKEVLTKLFNMKNPSGDIVTLLSDRLTNTTRIILGKEHKTRLEYWLSFSRCIGLTLSQDLPSINLKAGTTITREMARQMDLASIQELKVKTESGKALIVRKCKVQDVLTQEEILTVLNAYGLGLEGIVEPHDIDSYENKVLEPLSVKVLSRVRDNLNELNNYLARKIGQDTEDLASVLDIGKDGYLMVEKEDSPGRKEKSNTQVIKINKLVEEIVNMKETQMAEETNIMAVISKGYKINSAAGSNASKDSRDIKPNQYGRVCPIESPEGKKIGITTTLTVLSDIDESGYITTPYYDVKTGKTVNLNPLEEKGKIIASFDADLTQPTVPARLDGDVINVKSSDVDLTDVSPLQVISPVVSTIPCISNDYGKRALMAANMSRQAMPPIKAERPYVSTGVDSAMEIGVKRGQEIYDKLFVLAGIADEDKKQECYQVPIHLVSKDLAGVSKKLTFGCNHPLLANQTVQLILPHYQSTMKKTSINYEVNTTTGCKWFKDDIVVHQHDVDLASSTIDKDTLNYGRGVNITKDRIEEKGIALGKNMKILFKMFEGYGYEDAIIVNSDLVHSKDLAVVSVFEKRIEVLHSPKNYVKGEPIEKYGVDKAIIEELTSKPTNVSEEELKNIGSNGIVKVGTYLKSGDIVVAKNVYRYTKGTDSDLQIQDRVKQNCVRLEKGEYGYVLSTEIKTEDNTQVVYIRIGSIKDLEKGDKMAGRHGNKGVISRVVPREDMPFLEDGSIPDIILNPLGVPSRMNIGQLVEHSLGLISMHTGKLQVVEPFVGNNFADTINKLVESELGEVTVYDGRTGLAYPRKMQLGSMYMLRLEHMVSSKVHGIAQTKGNMNPRTLQAKQGKKSDGGQKVGELCSWAILSNGADELLDDLYSVHADDLAAKEELGNQIDNDPSHIDVQGTNKADDMVIAYMRAMGINMRTGEEGIGILPLTDTDTINLCKGNAVNLDLKENMDALHDKSIFGDESNRKKSNRNKLRTTYAYIDLGCKVIMPIYLTNKRFLNLIPITETKVISNKDGNNIRRERKYMTEKTLENLTAGKLEPSKEKNRCYLYEESGKLYLISKNTLTQYPELFTDISERLISGYEGVLALVKDLTWEDIKMNIKEIKRKLLGNLTESQFIASNTSTSQKLKTLTKLNTMLSDISHMESHDLAFQDFLVSKVAVLPVAFRPVNEDDSLKLQANDIDILYSNLLTAVRAYIKNKKAGIPTLREYNKINKALASFVTSKPEGNIKVNLLKEMISHSNKNSIIRDHTLGKRLDFSARTVITVNPNLKLNQCGLPFYLAMKIYAPNIESIVKRNLDKLPVRIREDQVRKAMLILTDSNVPLFIKTFNDGDYKTGYINFTTTRNIVKNMLQEYLADRYVLTNREPSLHKFNIQAFNPIITDGLSLEIHPMVCAGFNADFDGDTKSIIGLQTERSNRVARDKMSITHNIVNPKDGGIILNPGQDMVIGSYWATMHHQNKLPKDLADSDKMPKRAYNSITQIQEDIQLGVLAPQDFITYTHTNGNTYYSTAGRIWFNSLLPDNSGFTNNKAGGFSRCQLKFDDQLTKGKLKKVSAYVYENFGEDKLIEFLDKEKEFGFYFSDLSGISICLKDFETKSDVDSYVTKAEQTVSEVEEAYRLGELTKEEKSRIVIEIWRNVREDMKDNLVGNLSRHNNLFMIIDSGSRGDFDQFMETMGIVGIVTNTKREELEVPVKGNYCKGLGITEYFQNSYTTRKGQIATALETADVGYLTRQTIMMLEGIKVVEDKCQATTRRFSLEYDVDIKGRYLDDSDPNFAQLKDYLGTRNKITEATKQRIRELNIKSLRIVSGETYKEEQVEYKLSSFFTNYLQNRIPDPDEDLAYLHPKTGCITKATIADIERRQLQSIRIHTTLDCTSIDGICATSYGMYYHKPELPQIGDRVGFQSAQAIGEPSSQLTLNTFHMGAKGGSNQSSMQLLKQMINQSSKDNYAVLADTDGTVNVTVKGDNAFISVGNTRHKVPKETLLVTAGQTVKKGDKLTSGVINFQDLAELTNIENTQLEMLKYYFSLFENNRLDVYLRHFELLVKVQTQYVQILDAKNSGLTTLGIYPAHVAFDYNNKTEDKVVYKYVVLGRSDVLNNSNNVLSAIAEENFKDRVCLFTLNQKQDAGNSTIGRLLVGDRLGEKQTKPKFEIENYLQEKQEEESIYIDTSIEPDPLSIALEDVEIVSSPVIEETVIDLEDLAEPEPEPELDDLSDIFDDTDLSDMSPLDLLLTNEFGDF